MRTHYTPARVSRLMNWLAATLVALLLASAWQLDEPAISQATRHAINDVAQQARFERAGSAMCASTRAPSCPAQEAQP